jgi:tRNA(Ile)-lysidine synthase
MGRSGEDWVTGHQLRAAPDGERLHEQVRRTIERYNLLERGDSVIVAVSGGADSVALLHLLADLRAEYALTVHVAHLNHRLRPDADADAAFVHHMASRLSIPATVEAADVSALATAQKQSLEEAGRQARYDFFARVASATGASRVATAHTRDDDVETVAMRLLQGGSWEGLVGIRPIRPLGMHTVVRPLIETAREELRGYLQDRRIAWREDSTNRDRRFLRNWVRLAWLPALQACCPQCPELLTELRKVARGADHFLEQATATLTAHASRTGQTIRFELNTLQEFPLQMRRRVIRAAACEVCGTEVPLRDVVARGADDVVTGRVGREVRLDGCVVRRGYHTVEIAVDAAPPEHEYRLSVPGRVEAGDFRIMITAEVLDQWVLPPASGAPHEVYLDAPVVGHELVVRPWQSGDRMTPLGLGGTKKVHDIFVDGKIPRWERSRLPLVTDARGRILWIVGVAIADPAKVTADTSRVVRLRARGLFDTGRIAGAMAGQRPEGRELQA